MLAHGGGVRLGGRGGDAGRWRDGRRRAGRAAARAPQRDRPLRRRGRACLSTRAIVRSRRSIRCGVTAPPSGAGCGCPTAPESTPAIPISRDFPVGTTFWKEFAFAGRKVETRMFRKVARDRWDFASYACRPTSAMPRSCRAKGWRGWRKWHRQGAQHPVARRMPRLSRRRPHGGAGILRAASSRTTAIRWRRMPSHSNPAWSPSPHSWLRAASHTWRRGSSPRRRGSKAARPWSWAVLGYLSTNCGSCHNRESLIASLGLFLRYALARPGTCTADALATTIGQPGHWAVPDAPDGTSRILAPGEPARSALLRRAQSRAGRRVRCRPSARSWPIATR